MEYKFDIRNDNFNLFFYYIISNLTPAEKERIPPELIWKIFDKKGKPTGRQLPFVTMLYILQMSKNFDVDILIRDSEKGIGVYEYDKFVKEKRKRTIKAAEVDELITNSSFILGSDQLMSWMNRLASVSASAAMNYALKIKNATKIQSVADEAAFILNMIATYEGNKKRMVRQSGVTVADFYIMLYLYDGREKKATPCYKVYFKNAMGASRQQILDAFKKITILGYISCDGKTRDTHYRITALGRSVVHNIVKSYILP